MIDPKAFAWTENHPPTPGRLCLPLELSADDPEWCARAFQSTITKYFRYRSRLRIERLTVRRCEACCSICGDSEDLRTCEDCGLKFCWEHGQKGGDRQVQDVGAVAYPDLCDRCMGFPVQEKKS